MPRRYWIRIAPPPPIYHAEPAARAFPTAVARPLLGRARRVRREGGAPAQLEQHPVGRLGPALPEPLAAHARRAHTRALGLGLHAALRGVCRGAAEAPHLYHGHAHLRAVCEFACRLQPVRVRLECLVGHVPLRAREVRAQFRPPTALCPLDRLLERESLRTRLAHLSRWRGGRARRRRRPPAEGDVRRLALTAVHVHVAVVAGGKQRVHRQNERGALTGPQRVDAVSVEARTERVGHAAVAAERAAGRDAAPRFVDEHGPAKRRRRRRLGSSQNGRRTFWPQGVGRGGAARAQRGRLLHHEQSGPVVAQHVVGESIHGESVLGGGVEPTPSVRPSLQQPRGVQPRG
mmetsp:Transcript_32587/g.81029  ORF Transcript_32587/g.81029 Transcript_32587/m.81029 type:complete len:347 (-) Transcript_32587:111-1151(-)